MSILGQRQTFLYIVMFYQFRGFKVHLIRAVLTTFFFFTVEIFLVDLNVLCSLVMVLGVSSYICS